MKILSFIIFYVVGSVSFAEEIHSFKFQKAKEKSSSIAKPFKKSNEAVEKRNWQLALGYSRLSSTFKLSREQQEGNFYNFGRIDLAQDAIAVSVKRRLGRFFDALFQFNYHTGAGRAYEDNQKLNVAIRAPSNPYHFFLGFGVNPLHFTHKGRDFLELGIDASALYTDNRWRDDEPFAVMLGPKAEFFFGPEISVLFNYRLRTGGFHNDLRAFTGVVAYNF